MGKYTKCACLLFFIHVLFANTVINAYPAYSVYTPWNDPAWLNGWYTAASCPGQSTSSGLNYYYSPYMPNRTLVKASGNLNNYISFGSEGVFYNEPYIEYYSCNCDESGCSTCRRCAYREQYYTISGLGYSAGAWDLERYTLAFDKMEIGNALVAACSNFTPYIPQTAGTLANVSLDLEGDASNTVLAAFEDAYVMYIDLTGRSGTYELCRNSDSFVPSQYLATTYGDEQVRRSLTFPQILAVADPYGPSIPGSPCSVNVPAAPSGLMCRWYPLRWRETAGTALNIIPASFELADLNVHYLKMEYDEMSYAGLCDDDYAESPKQKCIDASSAVSIIESGAHESTYGKLAIAKDRRAQLQSNVFCFPPDFSAYPEIIKLLWQNDSGFIPRVINMKKDSEKAFSDANAIYAAYSDSADLYYSGTNVKKQELDSAKLYLITEAVTVTQFDSRRAGTIAERANRLYGQKADADALRLDAIREYYEKQRGYLKDSTAKMKPAIALYSGISENAALVLSDADLVVSEKKQSASVLIQQAAALFQKGNDATVGFYYKKALVELNASEGQQALGEKYRHYASAESYARTALNNGELLENETAPLVAKVEDLIRRAAIDGVNTESENTRLIYMKNTGEYDIPVLNMMVESILEKTGVKYGYLISMRAELLSNITAAGDCGKGFDNELQAADNGLITSSWIDYTNALGKLKQINSEYSIISEGLSDCFENILLSDIIVSKSVIISDIKPDEQSHASILVLVTNLGSGSGNNIDIPVSFGLDFPIMLSDIRLGKEDIVAVRTEGNNTLFTVKEMKPFSTFPVNIEKDTTLAKTVKLSSTTIGKDSGVVDVLEDRTIETYADGRIAIPYGRQATIDSSSSSLVVPKGTHRILSRYSVQGGYARNDNVSTSLLGTNVYVERKITITPKMDIDSLPIAVSFDYPSVSQISTNVRNAKISENSCVGSTAAASGAPCRITLGNIEKGKTAVLFIDFTVVNAKDSLPTLLPTIPSTENCFGTGKSCDQLPSEINYSVSQLAVTIAANDSADAVRLKESIDSKIAEWNAEQERKYNEINSLKTTIKTELNSINTALDKAGSANRSSNNIVSTLISRKDQLQSALSNAGTAKSLSDELSALQSAGSSAAMANAINNFSKQAWDDYNSLKVRLANAGIRTTPQEFIDVESRMEELEAQKTPSAALSLSDSLEKAESFVLTAEKKADNELQVLKSDYSLLKADIEKITADYSAQANAAKGSEWEQLFAYDTSGIDPVMEGIEQSISDKNLQAVKSKMNQLQTRKEQISSAFESVRSQATEDFAVAKNVYELKKEKLPQDARDTIEQELSSMANEISNGQYVQALKRGKALFARLAGYKEEKISPFLFVFAFAAVAVAIGVYYFKRKGIEQYGNVKKAREAPMQKVPGHETSRQKPHGQYSDIQLPFIASKKKEYKPLPKADD